MTLRIARIVAIAVCFVAPPGWGSIARADTTATVSVTGQVVDTSMSLSINAGTFAFGEIDATGDSYSAGTSLATPYEITGGGAFGIPDGLAWFANTPLVMTVSTPVTAKLTTCLDVEQNVVGAGGTQLYMSVSVPQVGLPNVYAMGASSRPCEIGPRTITTISAVPSQSINLYPIFLVLSTDTPKSFSATVVFAISPF